MSTMSLDDFDSMFDDPTEDSTPVEVPKAVETARAQLDEDILEASAEGKVAGPENDEVVQEKVKKPKRRGRPPKSEAPPPPDKKPEPKSEVPPPLNLGLTQAMDQLWEVAQRLGLSVEVTFK